MLLKDRHRKDKKIDIRIEGLSKTIEYINDRYYNQDALRYLNISITKLKSFFENLTRRGDGDKRWMKNSESKN